MGFENKNHRAQKRNRALGWWKKQWPWWRILLAVVFVAVFFGSIEGGIFPSELRTGIPSRYNGYWLLLSSVGLVVFVPLAVGPNWRQQGIMNSVLAVGFVIFVCAIYPRNLMARLFVEREMALGPGVTVTPTEFRLNSIEVRRTSRGGAM